MSIKQEWRDDFMAGCGRANILPRVGRQLMRYATTLQRLAVAQCNGDWPADNGERAVSPCDKCSCLWAKGSIRKRDGLCPRCRVTAQAEALAVEHGLELEFQGDPRGAIVSIKLPEGTLAVPS